MDKVAEIFEGIVPVLAAKAKACLNRNEQYGNDSVLSVILEAYNQTQEDEFDGHYYIFDIYDKDDLKFLVDRECVKACDIAYACKNFKDGCFRFDENGNMEEMPIEKIKQTLANNMETIVRCVLMYPEAYKKMYNLLVADSLLSSDFSQLC